jgi:hypothetical protein
MTSNIGDHSWFYIFKCPALEQGQECGRVKPVQGIRTPSRSPATKIENNENMHRLATTQKTTHFQRNYNKHMDNTM